MRFREREALEKPLGPLHGEGYPPKTRIRNLRRLACASAPMARWKAQRMPKPRPSAQRTAISSTTAHRVRDRSIRFGLSAIARCPASDCQAASMDGRSSNQNSMTASHGGSRCSSGGQLRGQHSPAHIISTEPLTRAFHPINASGRCAANGRRNGRVCPRRAGPWGCPASMPTRGRGAGSAPSDRRSPSRP